MGKSAVSPYRETIRLTCLLCHESTLARTRVECRRVAQAGFIPAASRIAAHRKKHSAGTGGATVIACYQDIEWLGPHLHWTCVDCHDCGLRLRYSEQSDTHLLSPVKFFSPEHTCRSTWKMLMMRKKKKMMMMMSFSINGHGP